jgi:hypothetical protein
MAFLSEQMMLRARYQGIEKEGLLLEGRIFLYDKGVKTIKIKIRKLKS